MNPIFIELKNSDATKVLINVNNIDSIQPRTNTQCTIHIGTSSHVINDSYERVVALIKKVLPLRLS